jgi:hypothetical protein
VAVNSKLEDLDKLGNDDLRGRWGRGNGGLMLMWFIGDFKRVTV